MKKTKALFAVVLTLILTVTFMPVNVMAARKPKPDDPPEENSAPIIIQIDNNTFRSGYGGGIYLVDEGVTSLSILVKDEDLSSLTATSDSDNIDVPLLPYEVTRKSAAFLVTAEADATTGSITISDGDLSTIVELQFNLPQETFPPFIDGQYPAVTGDFSLEGEMLSASFGEWNDDQPLPGYDETYIKWIDSKGHVFNTGLSYIITDFDKLLEFYIEVTVVDSDGLSTTERSLETYHIGDWNVEPLNTSQPIVVTDNEPLVIGSQLYADPGIWTDEDEEDVLTYTYEWYVDGSLVSNEDNYTPVAADSEKDLYVTVDVWDGTVTVSLSTPPYSIEAYVQPPEPDIVSYVALGDSIPYGEYNTSFWDYVSGGTDSYSYVEQFASYLNVADEDFYDLSVSGYNTIDVLGQIDSYTSLIREADVITLCVGANDIMDAAGRGFGGLSKYDINWSEADAGRDNFELYWYQVINKIEDLNPDVTLIVMTIYNPYRINDSYYNLVDPYFENSEGEDLGLNYIIENTETLYADYFGTEFDYKVADVYEDFNLHEDKDSLTSFYRSFCDPHPNQSGQDLIFQSHIDAYLN